MMATQKKTIVVFGATTGGKGNSVANALLLDGTFSVLAVGHNLSKPPGQALIRRGATVVGGDLNNLATLEKIMEGAYGAFVVTSFSDDFSQEQENSQAKNAAEVAKRLGLKHVIFGGLDHVMLSTRQRNVPLYDVKREAETHFWELGVPLTSVQVPCYYENFVTFCRPRREPGEDAYTITMPMGDLPIHAMGVYDLGPAVVNIFKAPEVYIGKSITLFRDALKEQEFAEILSQCLGKNIRDSQISLENYEQQTSKSFADMFRYLQTMSNYDEDVIHQLNPKARSFQQWVEEIKWTMEDL
ncbi:nmrA-like family domain-containing protein 1 [Eublepharis macularius]|uniref:NmrA-like family domain-containing protein 1 n=1 Tax=Eublepharis macularius TaxID=481883 RepID=A0AA97JAK3_EUBMA|nr:nmrA-like family domain-containing protein 1 [Eublepharis macularius]